MTGLHFAVLAHAHAPLVLDLVESLRDTYRGCTVSVFNGGRDQGFLADADVLRNPYSRPVRYGNMMPFHLGTLRWFVERDDPAGHLVTLDHDVMLLGDGLAAEAESLGPLGYSAARLRVATLGQPWTLGGSTIPYVSRHWRRSWQPLLAVPDPWWAFNPMQIFGADLVRRMLTHPCAGDISRRALRSRIWAIEEVVMPSWAMSSGGLPVPLPGEEGLQWRNVALAKLPELFARDDVHVVHRVPMLADAPERLAVRDLMAAVRAGGPPSGAGGAVDDRATRLPLAGVRPTPEPEPVLSARWTPARWRHAAGRRLTHLAARHRG